MNAFKLKPLVLAITLGLAAAPAATLAEESVNQADTENTLGQTWDKSTQKAERVFEEGVLEGKLQASLLFSEHLSVFDIDAEVIGSKAYLGGVVESGVEKDLAEEIALGIDGIDEVSNEIVVSGKPMVTQTEKEDSSLSSNLADATISAKVRMKYIADDSLSLFDLDVETDNKVVRLSGEVDSAAASELAEKIASNTDGVEKVVNELTVKSADQTASL